MIEYKGYRKKSLGGKRTLRHAARKTTPRRPKGPGWAIRLRRALPVAVVVIVVGLATAAGGAAYTWLGRSPIFAVREIDLNPCAHLTREEVRAILGSEAGRNIWTLSAAEIGRRIREHPWVRAVSVRKVFPDRIVVRVEEYAPVAMVNLDALWYVDDRGTLFKRLTVHDSKAYPIVTGFAAADLAARDAAAVAALRRTIELLRLADSGSLRQNVSEIHFDPQDGYTIVTRDTGLQLKIGTMDFRVAMKRIEDALPRLSRLGQLKGAVDLKHDGRIFVRPGE